MAQSDEMIFFIAKQPHNRKETAMKRKHLITIVCLFVLLSLSHTISTKKIESPGSKIVTTAEQIQTRFLEDKVSGNEWTYQSSLAKNYRTFSEAFQAELRETNCSDGVNKILKESGVVPYDTGFFYGSGDGSITWFKNAEDVYGKMADIYHFADGTTVKNLTEKGFLKPGDILTYYEWSHTNIYLGNNRWFDSGHPNCKEKSGDDAVFNNFCDELDLSDLKVGNVIRLKKHVNIV